MLFFDTIIMMIMMVCRGSRAAVSLAVRKGLLKELTLYIALLDVADTDIYFSIVLAYKIETVNEARRIVNTGSRCQSSNIQI